MRFLCLHGKGTSAEIFRIQTSGWRSKLPSSYTFDFIDAPYTSTAAPGVALFFDPPYYSFYASNSLSDIRESYSFLTEHLEKNGPYDGVLGFSQGCAVIAGYLLDHAVERPKEPLPFKCAIFICGGVPMPVVEDLGVEISERAKSIEERSRTELFAKASSVETVIPGTDYWARSKDSVLMEGGIDEENPYSLMVPEHMKIGIPTVHVYGQKDPRYYASLNLRFFSKAENRREYDHSGGHDVPRTTVVSQRIADLVKWVTGAIAEGK